MLLAATLKRLLTRQKNRDAIKVDVAKPHDHRYPHNRFGFLKNSKPVKDTKIIKNIYIN
jgi:hypothetical protein